MRRFFYYRLYPLIILAIISCSKQTDRPKGTSQASQVEPEVSPAKKFSETNNVFTPAPKRSIAGKYHGNVKTRILHGPGCKDYDCMNCTVGFKTVRRAKQNGYRPHTCIKQHGKKKKSKTKHK